MIDRRWIGHELPPSTALMERGRLAFFAKAIGETDPIYYDAAAAQNAGHPDIVVPPTFLFSIELDSGALLGMLDDVGVDLRNVLHGEQSFSYRRRVHAGDRLTVTSRITDIHEKKGGALEFIVKESRVVDAEGRDVADLRSVLVVRN